MTQKSTIELPSQRAQHIATAHRRAMKVLLVDILVTCAILAAVASSL